MPLVVLGDTVQCADTNNNIIFKKLTDFDDSPERETEENKIVEVSPIEEFNDDYIVDEEALEEIVYDGLFVEEEIKEEPKKVERKKNWYLSDEQYI